MYWPQRDGGKLPTAMLESVQLLPLSAHRVCSLPAPLASCIPPHWCAPPPLTLCSPPSVRILRVHFISTLRQLNLNLNTLKTFRIYHLWQWKPKHFNMELPRHNKGCWPFQSWERNIPKFDLVDIRFCTLWPFCKRCLYFYISISLIIITVLFETV